MVLSMRPGNWHPLIELSPAEATVECLHQLSQLVSKAPTSAIALGKGVVHLLILRLLFNVESREA